MTLAERCQKTELLLLDVDGVFTEGSIIYADNHMEIKHFHVRDGAGLKIWQRCGKQSAILSGRTSGVVAIRAAELDIAHIIQGKFDKRPSYQQLLAELNLRPEQVCYVGDDVLDVSILADCGLAVAVADACADAKRAAHYITKSLGGRGAIREVVELILRCQGHWQEFLQSHVGRPFQAVPVSA